MKPRRDITLGEMQDECSFRGGNCQTISCATVGGDMCVHYKICGKIGKPIDWDLSDPPRFNEQQMEFWRGWYEMGARKAVCAMGLGAVNLFDGKDAFALSGFTTSGFDCGLKNGEILDLAELLGKDAT